jgi:hypothetical protein
MTENLPKGRIPLLQKLLFKAFVKTPSGIISEPFEIFLVVFGMLAAVGLLLQHFQHIDVLSLPYYHGVLGEFIFAGVLLGASVLLIWALVIMHQDNLLSVRKMEILGLWLYTAAFGYYAYATVSVGLSLPGNPVYTVFNEILIDTLTVLPAVRAVALASPITAMTVERIHRIKLIKDQLRQTIAEDRKLRSQ